MKANGLSWWEEAFIAIAVWLTVFVGLLSVGMPRRAAGQRAAVARPQ